MLSAATWVSEVIVLETALAVELGWVPQIFLAPGIKERFLRAAWWLLPFSVVARDSAVAGARVEFCDSVTRRAGLLLRLGGTLVHSFLLSALPSGCSCGDFCLRASCRAVFSFFSAAISKRLDSDAAFNVVNSC